MTVLAKAIFYLSIVTLMACIDPKKEIVGWVAFVLMILSLEYLVR